MPVLHFSSVFALFEKDGLKSKINRMREFACTNVGNYWQLYEAMLVP